MEKVVNIILMDDIEAPTSFINLLNEKGFTVNITSEIPNNSANYIRSEHTTDYKGVKVLIKRGRRKIDYGIISILHIYGNKLYICGTKDLDNYVDKIVRDTLTKD